MNTARSGLRTAAALVSIAGFSMMGITAAQADPVEMGPYSTHTECDHYRTNDPSAIGLCYRGIDRQFYYNADYGF